MILKCANVFVLSNQAVLIFSNGATPRVNAFVPCKAKSVLKEKFLMLICVNVYAIKMLSNARKDFSLMKKLVTVLVFKRNIAKRVSFLTATCASAFLKLRWLRALRASFMIQSSVDAFASLLTNARAFKFMMKIFASVFVLCRRNVRQMKF
jgi:hypothetical protein